MTGPRMIGVAMRYQGPRNRLNRVDVEISRRAVKAGGPGMEQFLRRADRPIDKDVTAVVIG
jgi:hypothetical protein